MQLNDLTGEVGVGLGPKDWVDAERLDVDTLLIHYLSAFRRDHERRQLHLQVHQRVCLGHMAVGVHINGANALSVHDDLASPRRRLRQSGPHQTASDESKAGQRTSNMA